MPDDLTPIKPFQSSEHNASIAVVGIGLYKCWKVVETVRIKAPFSALEPADFVDIAMALAIVASGGFWYLKRMFNPTKPPIIAGPVATVVGRVTGQTEVP